MKAFRGALAVVLCLACLAPARALTEREQLLQNGAVQRFLSNTAALTLVASSEFAGKYQLYYADPTSVTGDRARRAGFLVFTVYVGSGKMNSAKELREFTADRCRLLSFSQYDRNGTLIGSSALDPASACWTVVAPGTVWASLRDYVFCTDQQRELYRQTLRKKANGAELPAEYRMMRAIAGTQR